MEIRSDIEPRTPAKAGFSLGAIITTRSAKRKATGAEIGDALKRHAEGDWGCLDSVERVRNERALWIGDRLLSMHRAGNGYQFWIMTDYDRACTTVF